MYVKLKTNNVKLINDKQIVNEYKNKIDNIHKSFVNKTCPSNDMLGWYDYPSNDKENETLLKNMQILHAKWKKLKIQDVIIIGIGGSYTGVKAILEFALPNPSKRAMNFHFLRSMASTSNLNCINSLKNKNWAVIVISKSGTTLESALNFRLVREILKKQYGSKHNERIVAITDPNKGVLHDLCIKHKYAMLPINGSIGGRFSTITSVGLFPAMLAGNNVKEILRGAKNAYIDLNNSSLEENSAYKYAAYRHYLYTKGKYDVENLITYENNLEDLCIQHRQLFGESEGKNKNSLYPTYSVCTTDLHSMGQLLQEGKQIFFETVFQVKNPIKDKVMTKSTFSNDDKLDYLVGKTLHEINYIACEATIRAHANAGINILQLELEDMSAYGFGYIYYWLSLAAATSASLLKHNPFDQPGVEGYKKVMFELLKRK